MTASSVAHWACQAVLSRLTLAHLAGALLLVASGLANFNFGLSIGHTDLERWIAGGASIGADVWNAAGLVLTLAAFRARRWTEGALCAVVLLATIAYSINAGIGFHSSGTADKVGQKAAVLSTVQRDDKRLSQVERRLEELGNTRPSAAIASEAAAILADKRAGDCSVLNGPYTRQHCPRYHDLKAEQALAEERERLEAERGQLSASIKDAGPVTVADPLNETVRKYLALVGVSVKAEDIRPWQTFLFVVVVVLGGPVAWGVAEMNRKPVSIRFWPNKADNENRPQPNPTTEETPAVESEPIVVRPRKIVALTPVAQRALDRLSKAGGTVQGKSQGDLAKRLGVPRTSWRRVADRLESLDIVKTSHEPGKGYTLRLAA